MENRAVRWLVIAGAALLIAFTYIYGLDGQHIPKNGDEYPYENITRLTAASGHWLPLQSDMDGMRNTKPPALFWQGMASTHQGVDWTLWHLRYPSVIYTLLTVALIFALAMRLTGNASTALVAAYGFAAFLSTYRFGRPFLTNPPEVFWFFLPWAALVGWRERLAASPWMAAVLIGGCLGIGLLYKSFALLAPAGLALAWLHLARRDYRPVAFLRYDVLPLLLIAGVALGLFGLWFALDPDPQSVWREFVVGENMGKFNPQDRGYVAKMLWGESSVWDLLASFLLNAGFLAFPMMTLGWHSLRQCRRLGADEKALWIWIAAWFLVFSFPSQRSGRYLLVAMPAVAILLALHWRDLARGAFLVTLALVALFTGLVAYLSFHLHAEVPGGVLYPLWHWLLLVAILALVVLGFVSARTTRPAALVASLLALLGLGSFVHALDGPLGNYSAEAIAQVRGNTVWVPCNFRAKDEGYRFILPGANIEGYKDDQKLTQQDLAAQGRYFAIRLAASEPLCEGCTILGTRHDIRSRHSEAEIYAMLRGEILQHLFLREALIQAPQPAVSVAPSIKQCH